MSIEKAEIDDDIELDTFDVEEPEVDDEDDYEVEDAEFETDDEPTEAEAEEEEDVVSINGEAPDPETEDDDRAPEWVRDLRKEYRNEKRRAKELEQKVERLERGNTPASQPIGLKPTLESTDYDTERYETELASWYEKKRTHDDQQNVVQSQQKAVQKEWEAKLESYHSSKADLKVKDYEFAEDVVQDNLSVMQQGMIVQGADNPALVVYALGKNPKKAKELASITDPVKFAFAVAKLETNLKVTTRKASSRPEKKISPSGTTLLNQYKRQKKSA
jgi:hypothetical protein